MPVLFRVFVSTMADHNHAILAPSPFSSYRAVSFDAIYFGDATLDRRHTPAMLPWLMAGVRRRSKGHSVKLVVGDQMLTAFRTNDMYARRDLMSGRSHVPALFGHCLNAITRFARIVHHPACFSYLTRPKSDSLFVCHVFEAKDEMTVRT